LGVPGAVFGASAIIGTHIDWRDRIVDLINLGMEGHFDEKGRFRDSAQIAIGAVAISTSGFADIRQEIAADLFHKPTGSP